MKNLIMAVVAIMLTFCSEKETQHSLDEVESFWTYYDDSTIYSYGKKINGKLEGKAFLFDKNGYKILEQNYINNTLEGEQIKYDDGKIKSIEIFKEGNLKGWAKYYNPSCGFLVEEGLYVDNKKSEVWFEYFNEKLDRMILYEGDSIKRIIYDNKEIDFSGKSGPPPISECEGNGAQAGLSL